MENFHGPMNSSHDMDGSTPEARTADRVAARLFSVLTGLVVVFILFASLIPSHSKTSLLGLGGPGGLASGGSIWAAFSAHDVRDISTNILLYIPLGLSLAFAVSTRRLRYITLWLLVGPGLSLAVEIGQVFIHRHSDFVDIVTNSTGHCVGYWLAVLAMKRFDVRPAALVGLGQGTREETKVRIVATLRFLYISVYFIVALVPLDISVSVSQIYEKLLPDAAGRVRIIIDPLHHLRTWPEGGSTLLISLLGLLPVAALTGFLDGLRKKLSLVAAIYVTVMVALVGEGVQVFIVSRTTDVAALFIAVLAGCIGWVFVKIVFELRAPGSITSKDNVELVRRRLGTIALMTYVLFLGVLVWWPFNFELELESIKTKIITGSNALPFRSHFQQRSIGAAVDLVKEVGIFIPMGLLLAFLLPRYFASLSRKFVAAAVITICLILAAILELSQAACVGRYIDVTDVLLGAAGGFVGAHIFYVFVRTSRHRKPGH